MIVVHLCQSADPNVGGSLTVARALVKAQRELGVESWLVFLYADDPATPRIQHQDHEITCGAFRRSRWTLGVLRLRQVLNHLRPDVIHHHDGILWPRLATLGMSCVLVTHGHLGCPRKNLMASSYWTHRLTMAGTDCLIAISSWVAGSWERSGFPKSKIRLLPNGVDGEKFYPRPTDIRQKAREELGVPSDEFLLLWAGRLDRETKGLERLVAVARELPARVRLLIAGGGPDECWLREKLQALPTEHGPIILGKVADAAELFGVVDSFLFTSKVEPFGLVLLEAAVSGLPIFAFECEGGGMELLQELNALVVPEKGAAELARAITTGGGQLSPALLLNVQEKYNWRTLAASLIELYKQLL
jgi:glycosyltransferase involved in cell wall biosynthesis